MALHLIKLCVGADTIDDLRLDRLDLLKLGDTAPASQILAGAKQSLWNLRPIVFASVRRESDLEPLRSGIGQFGYRCWHAKSPLYDPDNFNRRTENIFGDQLAHAVLAIPEETPVEAVLVGCTEMVV